MDILTLTLQSSLLNGFGAKREDQFRNYEDSSRQEIVSKTYREHHIQQTFQNVQLLKRQHLQFNKGKMTLWDVIHKLDELVDDSDPDADFPQIYHALQTAESLRRDWPDLDWMHLVGLLHDAGKVLALPEFGGCPQWAVVGDTYPVGCKFSPKIVYPHYLSENPDHSDDRFSTPCGIYEPNCGHDEYMYQVCLHNKTIIPPEGLSMIRFHSFYAWHKEGEYQHLMKEEDYETLKWVQRFNKGDLYSKCADLPDPQTLKPYYESLLRKYFPDPLLEW
eukprot:TRINITY_DN951_c0_g1_i3.p1 TRINITY_DN951_c0_g1~~TRINITY_DN951_c0_g1_i3.p1  ORF type:complete len:276 (-),score=55.58 TRINITY_DN951_c0_g1_i3:82-909(-)